MAIRIIQTQLVKEFLAITGMVISCMILISCDQNSENTIDREEKNEFLDIHLTEFKKRFSILNYSDWRIEKAYKTDELISFNLYRLESGLFTNVDLTIDIFGSDSTYSIRRYIKHWEGNGYKYYMHLDEGIDTLYYYRTSLEDSINFEFIYGKYRYMFDNMQLTANQARYFKAHEDSLAKIKGNDLKPLPNN